MGLSKEVKHVIKQFALLLGGFCAFYSFWNYLLLASVNDDITFEQLYSNMQSLNLSAWITSILALVFSALVAIWQTHSQSVQINRLQQQITQIKEGHTASNAVTADDLSDLHQRMQQVVDKMTVTANKKVDLTRLQDAYKENRDTIYTGIKYLDTLAANAHTSSSAAMEMVAASNEVAENIQNLTEATEETSSNIEEMTFSIKEVAHNIEELSALAEETAAAMNQMDVSIGQVENNAMETAKLSEEVNKDADHGVGSITRTIAGINKIKETSESSAAAIKSLESKIEEIGAIINVIDEVAEQTNLLALNAAIIAAQSGEHGRGFAVVADEIKDLAERTGNSTKEIAALIKSIQDETKKAVGVIEQGTIHVEQGVNLSYEAESALRKILDSVGHSMSMVKAIAQATVEQTQSSKQVTAAITKIAQNAQQISMATNEQARGSEQLVQAAEKMRLIALHVERSSMEQGKAGQDINNALSEINQAISTVEEFIATSRGAFKKLETELSVFSEEANAVQKGDVSELQQVLASVSKLSMRANNS